MDKKENASIKRKTPIIKIITTIILIVAVGGFLVFGKTFLPNLPFGISLFKEVTVREMIFEYMKPINELTTVEYYNKVIFPYDFYNYEIEGVKKDDLTVYEQYKYKINHKYNEEIIKLCDESGLKLDRSKYEFMILSPLVSIGVDFSDTLYNNPIDGLTEEDWDNMVVEDGENGKKVTITLPPIELIDLQLVDNQVTADGARINLDKLGEIKKHVYLKMKLAVGELGLIEKAKENIEKFFTTLLTKTRDIKEVEIKYLERKEDKNWDKDENKKYSYFYEKFKYIKSLEKQMEEQKE